MEEPNDQGTPNATKPDVMARSRRWIAITVALSVLGWLVYALFRGFSETADELYSFRWGLYIPVLLLTLLNYSLRCFKWHYLLGRLGIHIPLKTNIGIFITGLAMVISPAKAGEVVKPYLVRVITGEPMSKTIPALVTERATDAIAVLILATIGISSYHAEGIRMILFASSLIAAALLIIAVKPLAMACIGLVRHLSNTVADRLETAYLATRSCVAPVPFFVTISVSLVAWWAECVGYWLVFKGLNVEVSLSLSTFLYSFATVFGAPMPGGLGMADAALVEGPLQLVDGLTSGQALAASMLIRLATLWFGVILGAIALLRIDALLASGQQKSG
ncbi:MAG: flippase-like domain-containing protein [Proteobacteria bacterium]|nr:flippase-like domain-containing protein [Pseudomonadota bacterium]